MCSVWRGRGLDGPRVRGQYRSGVTTAVRRVAHLIDAPVIPSLRHFVCVCVCLCACDRRNTDVVLCTRLLHSMLSLQRFADTSDRAVATLAGGVSPVLSDAGVTAPLRADAVTEGGDVEEAVGNARRRVGDYLTVPKVVE